MIFFIIASLLSAPEGELQLISIEHDVWVDDAARLLDQGQAAEAVPLLTRYLQDVQKRPESANFNVLGKAWLLLAAAHAQRGKEDDARQAIEQLARLRPDLALDASRYPPLFIRLHKKALQRAKAKANAALRVSAAEDASIRVNGRVFAQGLITHVPPGTHFVALQLGARQLAQRVEVKSGATVSVAFSDISGAQEREPQSYFDAPRPEETPPVQRRVLQRAEEPAPQPPVEQAPRVIAAPPPEEPQPRVLMVAPADVAPPRSETQVLAPTPLYKRWWLWTLVGAAVAGGAVAAALVVTAKVGDVTVSAQWQ